jgi:hypothetical protein
MALYKETSGTVQQYNRAFRIIINNSYNEEPNIVIEEEIISEDDKGRASHKIHRTLQEVFTQAKANTRIPLLHPVTGESINGEDASYTDVYILLRSLYLKLAQEQDAREALGEGDTP